MISASDTQLYRAATFPFVLSLSKIPFLYAFTPLRLAIQFRAINNPLV